MHASVPLDATALVGVVGGLSESLSEEGIEGDVLRMLERMRMWKRIAFVGNLCLWQGMYNT
jgi:hypothetical protein